MSNEDIERDLRWLENVDQLGSKHLTLRAMEVLFERHCRARIEQVNEEIILCAIRPSGQTKDDQ